MTDVTVLARQATLLALLDRDDSIIEVLYGGAMGGGKSHGIAVAAAHLSLKYPNNRGFIGRNDFKDLRETTYETCINLWSDLGIIAQHHKGEHWVRFVNGSTVLFGELKDKESRKSLNLGWFAIDEASEVDEDAYLMLLSRLRWTIEVERVIDGITARVKVPVPYRAILASNPEPGWLKRAFVDKATREPGRYFVRSLATDNNQLPPGYVERLKARFTDVWVKRYLGGSWDAFEGAVFPEFEPSRHVKPAIVVPEDWIVVRAIDHGTRNPTACIWLAVDPADDAIHAVAEHYLAGQPPSVHAAAILAKSGEREMLTVIDPSTAALTSFRNGSPWSVRDEYALCGIATDLANNSRMAGIIRMKELLRQDKFFIHENCVNLLRELPEYAWKEVSHGEQPEDAEDGNDHALDATRYGVVLLRPQELTAKPRSYGMKAGKPAPRRASLDDIWPE